MGITHTQLQPWDPMVNRVRTKFQHSINELAPFGFKECCCYSETTARFGLFGSFPALFFEIGKVHGLLRISIYNIILVSREYATFALIMGLGTKFYTAFTDGTLLITRSFASSAPDRTTATMSIVSRPGPLEQAWNDHRASIQQHQSAGRLLREATEFEDYVALSLREEETS